MIRAFPLFLLAACGHAELVIPTEQLALASDLTSFELWALDQVGRDGAPITCEELLSLDVVPQSENVVALADPVRGDFADGASLALKGLRSGDRNVIFYVAIYSEPAQLGTRSAAGCLGAQSITGGRTTSVVLEVHIRDTLQ